MCFLVVWTNAFIRKVTDNNPVKLILLSALLSLMSCQNSAINEDQIDANYYIRYTEADSLMQASATFQSNQQKAITFLGGVRLIDQKMILDQKDNTYTLEIKKPLPNTLDFKFQNSERKEILFTSKPVIPKFTALPESIKLTQDLTFQIDQAPTEDGESLGIFIIGASRKTEAVFFEASHQLDHFIFPATKLKKLQPGNGQLYFLKREKFTSTQDGVNHEILFEYYSKPVEMALK